MSTNRTVRFQTVFKVVTLNPNAVALSTITRMGHVTMKHIKAFAFGLLLASQLIYSDSVLSATGTLILRDKDNAICSIYVPGPGQTAEYNFFISPPCPGWSDRTRTIQLAEIPSATIIFLADSGGCEKYTTSTWFEFRTTKKQTSTSIIQTEYLTGYHIQQIIEPGLQLIDRYIYDPNFRDKLSCVKITTSRTPPSP